MKSYLIDLDSSAFGNCEFVVVKEAECYKLAKKRALKKRERWKEQGEPPSQTCLDNNQDHELEFDGEGVSQIITIVE